MRKDKFNNRPIFTYWNSYLAPMLGEISKTTEMDYSLLSLKMISLCFIPPSLSAKSEFSYIEIGLKCL